MIRAVIYCRCSTEEESQKNALEKQVAEAESSVRQYGWVLVDRYVESRSGTTAKGRNEYKRLFNDLLTDKFDVIVIKSQDRLMRNTKDWYLFVDRLCTEQKKLYMYIENKFYSTDDALITGIKAILAEEYSRELSKKINNAHRNRQRDGGNVMLPGNAYGFKRMPDKSVALVEKEAEIKREMYRLCAAGYGTRTISTIMRNRGIVNRDGKPFTSSYILRMLRNPINKGTAVMGKYHFDFDSKRTIKNPKEKIYIHEDKVPRTVSDELWYAANEQIDKRSVKIKDGGDDIGKNPGKYQLSGKIVCGMCGQPYWRKVHRKHSNHELIYTWACSSYLELGRSDNLRARPNLRKVFLENEKGCDNINIAENEFYAVLEEICSNQYQKNKKKIIEKIMKLLSKSLNNQDGTKEIEKLEREQEDIERKMKFLVDKLIDGVLTDQMYKTKQEELEKKRDQNKKKILELTERTSNTQNIKDRLQEIETRLNDDDLFKKATIDDMLEEVDKIVVYPRYMEIYFSLSSVTGCMDLKIFDGDKKCFRVDYGNRLDYKGRQCDAREVVVDLIRENPRITGKMIAKEIGCSLSGANYKLKVLKKEGRIRFNGAGGKGCWEILE